MTANDRKTHWKFHWLTRWEEIWDEGFVRQWQAWLDDSFSAHVFFHPALVKAWVETYLPLRDLRPCFLIAESADHTVFLPLVLWRRNWKNAFQKLLIPVGYSDYDYHDPIVVGKEEMFNWPAFWREIISLVREQPPLLYDRFLIDGIRSGFAGMGNEWKTSTICPWIDLSEYKNIEDFLKSLKKNFRGELSRRKRRMMEVGETDFIIISDLSIQEALQELPPFLQEHSHRWPDAYKAPHFHEKLICLGMNAGVLHFSAFRIGSKTTAWHMSFTFKGRFFSYMPAQTSEFDRLSPGSQLTLKCIEDAIDKGFSTYDFLRGVESYKAGWTDKAEILWSLRLDGNHLTSRIRNVAVDRAKHELKTLLLMK